MRLWNTLLGLAVLQLSCSQEDSTKTTEPADLGASDGDRCSPASGSSGNPKTIHELLDLINGLPHPVEFPCFLESLDRPLALNATSNTQSAQPALGKRSPRIFVVLNDSFRVSLVPGAATLEYAEIDSKDELRSVKGELHFPIEGQLALEDAFARIAPDPSTGLTLDQATRCGVCHDNEAPTPDYPVRGAFSSAIVRPAQFFTVDVAAIRREREACDSAAEPERCAMLEAMFDHGDVVQTAFP